MSTTIVKTEGKMDELFKLFDLLPVEMKEEIFKRVPKKDLKNIRLVCAEWNVICGRYITFKTVNFKSQNIAALQKTEYFHLIHTMELTKRPTFPLREQFDPTIFTGVRIRSLTLKNPNIESEDLKWLFNFASNLEELNVDYANNCNRSCVRWRFDLFLKTELPESISLCKNLKTLNIYAIILEGQAKDKWKFDCSTIFYCPKLENFNIQSTDLFVLRNCVRPNSETASESESAKIKLALLVLLRDRAFSLRMHYSMDQFYRLMSQFPIRWQDWLCINQGISFPRGLFRSREYFPCLRHVSIISSYNLDGDGGGESILNDFRGIFNRKSTRGFEFAMRRRIVSAIKFHAHLLK